MLSGVADSTTIGRRLKQLREERGWSRRDVEAALIKVGEEPISPSTLEKWESGKAEPRATSVAILAKKVYDVSLDYIFELED